MFTKKLKTALLFISLTALVVFRYFLTRPVYVNNQKLRITSRVFLEPVKYPTSQSLKLAGLTIYLPLFPEINYGDTVVIEGIVQKKQLKNPVLVSLKNNNFFLYRFRQKILAFYQKTLPEPSAGLIAGTVLGSKASLTTDFWEKVKKTGTAHVVVASGMNVSILAGFLLGITTVFLPRKKAIPIVLAGIFSYSILAGMAAPIIRAAIMGSVAFIAQEIGRLASAWKALCFSALLMLAVKPEWLGDLGFLLSFVATASLLLFEAKIRKKLAFVPEFFQEGFSTSLAAQIGVAPILFVSFGQFNLLSPLINALILWTVPAITIIGAVGGIVGLLLPGLGKIILYLVYPLTWWFIEIVQIFS